MAKRRRRSRQITKAVPTANQGARSAAGTVQAMTQGWYNGTNSNAGFQAAPRDPDWSTSPFAPSQPVIPVPVNRPGRDGRTAPRGFEAPVGWNLPGSVHRHIPWHILRDAADRISLFRRCIEIRKDHIRGLDWGFRVAKGAIKAAELAQPGTPRARLERELRQQMSDDIDRAEGFWRFPDRLNDYAMGDWLGLVLEEHYVLDALPIYPKRTFGGDVVALQVPDAATIKILLDEYAQRPQPPYPAYQQILWGFPRGEFTASIDDDGTVTGGFTGDELIYKRRNVRTWTPYGYSAVEQALDDGDLYLKRQQWMKAEYTHGAMPKGWFEVHPDAGLTPQQVAALERFYNDLLAGQTDARMEARFLPPGITPSERGDIAEKYKPDYDIFLLQKAISHFDTVITELGFTESKGGLGSSGYHEGQENVQDRKTLAMLRWLQHLITSISHRLKIASRGIEFYFLGLDEEDERAADELEAARQEDGVILLNERRTRLGYDPYDFPEADMPFVKTQRGIIFLEGASQLAPAGAVIQPPEVKPGKQPDEPAQADDLDDEQDGGKTSGDGKTSGEPEPPVTNKPPDGKPVDGDVAAKKSAELRAYRRWAAKGTRARDFRWEHHTPTEIAELTKASDAGPKAPSGQTWPGWDKDLEVAHYWAGEWRRASTGAINPRVLAERWLTARKDADSDAGAWLSGQDPDLVAALQQVLTRLYTEAYLVGQRSAQAMVRGLAVDWSNWTPGNPAAAEVLIGEDMNLRTLLDSAGVTIKSIAANRLDELAHVLAESLDNGDSVDMLAETLTAVLDDSRWAELVAITETSRAVSVATQATYRDNGIAENTWMTALDQRVCVVCDQNEAYGPNPVGVDFPSGQTAPPAHPACRCALAPVVE